MFPALEDRLKWLGLNKKQLAEKIGVNYKKLVKQLCGDNIMDVGTAIKISKALDRTVEELFRYYETEE